MSWIVVILAFAFFALWTFRSFWVDAAVKSDVISVKYFFDVISSVEYRIDHSRKTYRTTDFLWAFYDRYQFGECRIRNLVNRVRCDSFLIPIIDDDYDYILISPNSPKVLKGTLQNEEIGRLNSEISEELVFVLRLSGFVSFIIGIAAVMFSVAFLVVKLPWVWTFIRDDGYDLPLVSIVIPLAFGAFCLRPGLRFLFLNKG